MQSTTEISQKGLNDMKELNIMEATVLTSPNPLTLICSKKEDGSTNLAPICFVSYLSFNPPMVGFATGKQSHTGKQVRETGKVIVTVPGESLAQVVMACGGSTGAQVNKVAANNIEMMAVEGSDIQIPVDTRLAMVATLQQSVEWATISCTSVRWISFWAMRTRRACMPGTASGKLHLRQKAKS